MNCCKHISATGPEISRGTLTKKRKKVAKSPHILPFVQTGGEGGKKENEQFFVAMFTFGSRFRTGHSAHCVSY